MKKIIAKKVMTTLLVSSLLLAYHILGPVENGNFSLFFYIMTVLSPFFALFISEIVVRMTGLTATDNDFSQRKLYYIFVFTGLSSLTISLCLYYLLKREGLSDILEISYSIAVAIFIEIIICNVCILEVKNRSLLEELKYTESTINKHERTQMQLAERVRELDAIKSNTIDISITESNQNAGSSNSDSNIASIEANETAERGNEEEESEITLTGTTKDTLTVKPSDFVYAKSEGNYVYICYIDQKGHYANTLLRSKIQAIEEQLDSCHKIVRCHRSYVVNLAHVTGRENRQNGLMLIIDTGKERVPVSRSYDKGLREQIRTRRHVIACIISLIVAASTIGALPLARLGDADGHKRYISIMGELELLKKKDQNMKAMYAAHALMEESKRKHDRVGMFAASCKMYELYTMRRNEAMSRAYADTMRMYMPDSSYKKYIDELVIDGGEFGFATSKEELETIRKIKELCKENKYKEAYELELKIEEEAKRIQSKLANEDYSELSLAKLNDSLTVVSTRQKLKIAQSIAEQSRIEAEKAKLEAEKARNAAERKETELKKAELAAHAAALAQKIEIEKEKAKTERIKQETKRTELEKTFLIALCIVIVIGLLFILYGIYTYRKNMKELNHIIETVLGVFLGLFMMVSPAVGKEVDKGSVTKFENIFSKATHTINPEKGLLWCDSLEAIAQQEKTPKMLFKAIYAKVILLNNTTAYRWETDFVNKTFALARERSKVSEGIVRYWNLYSINVSVLSHLKRHSDAKAIIDAMFSEAKKENDYVGVFYANRALTTLALDRGDKGTIKECLYKMIDANKHLTKKCSSVDPYRYYSEIETDRNEVKKMLMYGLENTYNVADSTYMFCFLANSAAKECNYTDFMSWYKKVNEMRSKMEAAKRHFNTEWRIKMEMFKSAFEGNKTLAYCLADSLGGHALANKKVVAIILQDYKTAYECSAQHSDIMFKTFSGAVDFDDDIMAGFIEHSKLMDQLTEQRLGIIRLETKKNALLCEKEKALEQNGKERQMIAEQHLQNVKEEEEQKKKENDLHEAVVMREQKIALEEQRNSLQSRKISIIVAISLLLLSILGSVGLYNQRKNMKALDRIRCKMEEKNIG